MKTVEEVLNSIGLPLPWYYENGAVYAANGKRVWDVDDANDDSRAARVVVAVMNAELGAEQSTLVSEPKP